MCPYLLPYASVCTPEFRKLRLEKSIKDMGVLEVGNDGYLELTSMYVPVPQ